MSHLQQIDVKALSEILQGQQHRQLKRQLIKAGFKHQMSMYGVVKDARTGSYRYVRIEVLSTSPYDLITLPRVCEFFNKFKPTRAYTIWTYDHKTDLIELKGAWR